MKRVSRAALLLDRGEQVVRGRRRHAVAELRKLVTAPVIDASGVRRSCDSEDSSVVRSFSFSSSAAVRTASLDQQRAVDGDRGLLENDGRARARPVGEIGASRSASARSRRRRRRRAGSTSGRNWKRTFGQRAGAPAGRLAACRRPSAPRSFSPASSSSIGGQAARSGNSPSSGSSMHDAARLQRLLDLRSPWPRACRRASPAPDSLRENSNSDRVVLARSRTRGGLVAHAAGQRCRSITATTRKHQQRQNSCGSAIVNW